MIDVLYYGKGQNSQQVIDVVDSVIDADVGYRFEPASMREDNRAVWGVRVYSDSVDEQAITNALENEFGSVSKA